eukprot:SAG31_NODE_2388_length_5808_cov_2.772640_4_plen_97_part_00
MYQILIYVLPAARTLAIVMFPHVHADVLLMTALIVSICISLNLHIVGASFGRKLIMYVAAGPLTSISFCAVCFKSFASTTKPIVKSVNQCFNTKLI